MVKLNEVELENVAGGTESDIPEEKKLKIPKCIKRFANGFAAPYAIVGVYAHDTLVSEENKIEGLPRSASTGIVVGMASYCALSIGAYEGIKFIRRKIKGRK